jgi:Ca2+/Na+ antiporter
MNRFDYQIVFLFAQVYLSRGVDQEPTFIEVNIWNDTVANLTLMALGSSAPEILLSIIGINELNFNFKYLDVRFN